MYPTQEYNFIAYLSLNKCTYINATKTKLCVSDLVAVLERLAPLLLEAVDGGVSVPDRLGERVLAAHPVLVHGSEGLAPDRLGLGVQGCVPELLQVPVLGGAERAALQDAVQLLVSPLVEGQGRAGLSNIT